MTELSFRLLFLCVKVTVFLSLGLRCIFLYRCFKFRHLDMEVCRLPRTINSEKRIVVNVQCMLHISLCAEMLSKV